MPVLPTRPICWPWATLCPTVSGGIDSRCLCCVVQPLPWSRKTWFSFLPLSVTEVTTPSADARTGSPLLMLLSSASHMPRSMLSGSGPWVEYVVASHICPQTRGIWKFGAGPAACAVAVAARVVVAASAATATAERRVVLRRRARGLLAVRVIENSLE